MRHLRRLLSTCVLVGLGIVLGGGCGGPAPTDLGADDSINPDGLDTWVGDSVNNDGSADGSSSGDASSGDGDSTGDNGSGGSHTGGDWNDGGGDAGGNDSGGSGSGGGSGGGDSDSDGTSNNPPTVQYVIDPGDHVDPGAAVTIDASNSADPDGDPIGFQWRQWSGPAVELPTGPNPMAHFDAPYAVDNTDLTFELTVNDDAGGKSSVTIRVTVVNGGEFAGYWQSAEPYRDVLTPDEAYHLLRRAAMGASPEDVQRAVDNGLAATVDDLLTLKPIPQELQQLAAQAGHHIHKRWLVYLLDGPNPLHERMTLFWHDRFATSRSILSGLDSPLAIQHWKMLRRNALGNYRQFLVDLTMDPLMLLFLDGGNSPKDNPNENYAREFWELFTLGRDTLYTEADIKQSAKAFTGIRLFRDDNNQLYSLYDPTAHNNSSKLIFPDRASAANHDYLSVIDLTLAQPEAARYVARNLFVFFVHDQPSDALVDDLAATFVDSGFEINPLVRRILMSQAMFAKESRNTQISSPIEHIVGVAHTLDMHMYSDASKTTTLDTLEWILRHAGQELSKPPGVQGWDEGGAWLRDGWIISRLKALRVHMEFGPDHTPDLPYHLLPPADTWNTPQCVVDIVDALEATFHLKLTWQERDVYYALLNPPDRLPFYLCDFDRQRLYLIELVRLMAMHEDVIGR
jgi:uncharacterized protein (DUF1800 family)